MKLPQRLCEDSVKIEDIIMVRPTAFKTQTNCFGNFGVISPYSKLLDRLTKIKVRSAKNDPAQQ
jgi:hypothetical protein